VVISYCLYMFVVSGVERSTCLSCVFYFAILAFHFVNATSVVFVCVWVRS
jgi:hypothetical protein